ncbi:MAG: 7-carboxy-7-deazaguanine synthase QueE [Candidatus Margulisiibacteriota bacterium]|jgi:organic radical activating enzyme
MLVQDLFFSFQGEGLLIGLPQVFLRLWGCNLSCEYCDEISDHYQDLTTDAILNKINEYLPKKPHSLVLTGGEPLLQVEDLKKLLPNIKLPIFLETNGTLPLHLTEIIDMVSFFSVDYKIGYEKEFIDFLFLINNKLAANINTLKSQVYIKFVVLKDFNILELQKLVKIINKINNKIPLVLQPVSITKKIKHQAKPEDLFRAYQIANKYLDDVRIIPQTHKFTGLK